jgi:CheY-like chemotaxis protein
MDDETRRKCMEPFFTTKGERGTGLGLAMVYGIVKRHGASIDIASVPGKGTQMQLIFAIPQQPAAAGSTTPQDDSPPVGLRLLLVDDDPQLLNSLRDALQLDGHHITTASDGSSGIDSFRHALADQPFAAVITDLGMPRVDGRAVAKAVKEMSPGTPVILLTGWGQRPGAGKEILPHIDRVVGKPPKLRDLRAALAQYCTASPVDEVERAEQGQQ